MLDTNGVLRAEMGHLAANGISPAQYGFRASDATGTPIFDSLGLIGVMKLLGSADMSPQNQNFSTASTSTLVDTGVNVSFTLTRQGFVLVVWYAPAKLTAGTQYAILDSSLYQGGVFQGAVDGGLLFDKLNGYVTITSVANTQLAAGTYQIRIQAGTDSGVTLAVRSIHCDVYQLGQ